jgi:hypothetical protein
VTVSTSTDDSFSDLTTHEHPFDRIVFPDDPERFIHVPTSPERNALQLSAAVRCSLADLGMKVSTGPVVDFRLKDHLRAMPEPGTVPLLYPGHFSGSGTTWPMPGAKKANAIVRDADSEKWLYPSGFYCVVRRFSSKEEKRRIVASVVEPAAFGDAPMLGFENHLNVFHEKKQGLPQALAHGLALFLNSTDVDENFRRFNGHTQVNATERRSSPPWAWTWTRTGKCRMWCCTSPSGIGCCWSSPSPVMGRSMASATPNSPSCLPDRLPGWST